MSPHLLPNLLLSRPVCLANPPGDCADATFAVRTPSFLFPPPLPAPLRRILNTPLRSRRTAHQPELLEGLRMAHAGVHRAVSSSFHLFASFSSSSSFDSSPQIRVQGRRTTHTLSESSLCRPCLAQIASASVQQVKQRKGNSGKRREQTVLAGSSVGHCGASLSPLLAIDGSEVRVVNDVSQSSSISRSSLLSSLSPLVHLRIHQRCSD